MSLFDDGLSTRNSVFCVCVKMSITTGTSSSCSRSSSSMQSISITNSPTDSKLESSPQSESCSETEDDANSAEIQEAKQFLLQHQYDLFTDRSVGNGSYGKVYVVKHLTEKKLYVAKIVALDSDQDLYTQLKQMVREIRVLKILKNHPNICLLYTSPSP